MKVKVAIALVILCGFFSADAQIRITSVKVEDWVKNNFAGQGIVIGNIKHKEEPSAAGTFTNPNKILELNSGIILSTGYAADGAGLNDKFNQSWGFNTSGRPEADKDLQKLVKGPLYDISYLEFDFVPSHNSIQFNYQFGSDEYPEYVGSVFNDVFAFFISDEKETRNIAIIPGTGNPVSVNTINAKSNQAYFIDNNVFSEKLIKREISNKGEQEVRKSLPGRIWDAIKRFFSGPGDKDSLEVLPDEELIKKVQPNIYKSIQYDGITKKLVAQTFVEPYKKYHLKIIIADVSDNVYDSSVFLESKSLTAKKDPSQPGFVDYPDLSKVVDAKQILQGKNLEEVLPKEVKIPFSTIYFDFDKSEIKQEETEKLKTLAGLYQRLKNSYFVELSAHTDSIGNLNYNLELSNKRAQAVLNSLEPSGQSVIKPQIKAFSSPVAENTTEAGRARNRRVEVKFIKK